MKEFAGLFARGISGSERSYRFYLLASRMFPCEINPTDRNAFCTCRGCNAMWRCNAPIRVAYRIRTAIRGNGDY